MNDFKYLRTAICIIASFFTFALYGQKIDITGAVLDSINKEPLIGVTVMEKGTTNGVSADFDGKFKIQAAPKATLIFSCVGYTSKEVKLSGQRNITVLMQQASKTLDEFVVIGYGIQRKSDITGSISSISGKDVNDVPVASALQALQGKASGVNIIQNTGAPGSIPLSKFAVPVLSTMPTLSMW